MTPSSFVSEITTRQAQRDALAALFRARPHAVITHAEITALIGDNVTPRISDVRKLGLVIENVPVFKADGTRGYGSYTFRPDAQGREASTFVPGNPETGTLFDTWPSGWQR